MDDINKLEEEFEQMMNRREPPRRQYDINKVNEDFERDARAHLFSERKIKKHLRKKGYQGRLIDKIYNNLQRESPDIKYINNMSYEGHKFIRIMIKEDKNNNRRYRKENIREISNKFSRYLHTQNIQGKLLVTTKYNKIGWRSGYFTNIGDDVNLYTYADSDIRPEGKEDKELMPASVIYMVLTPKNQGGEDENNDCLFNCLKFVLNDYLPFSKGWELKRYLNLKRADKIPTTCIPKIEKLLKTFQINIRGDYIYSSPIKTNKQVNLLLINEHYTIDKEYHKYKFPKINIGHTEKIPILYNKSTFEIYDGNIKKKITKEERNKILWDRKGKYIIIDNDEQNIKNDNIEEDYKNMVETFNILKNESHGYINMFKSGTIKNTSLDLFDRFTKYLPNPESILQDEFYWIEKSKKGALIWSEPYEGTGYKYDVKSMYPFILISNGKIPIGRGEFKNIDNLDNLEYFQYGIYRCIIKKSEDDKINRLFRFNEQNYYTHISLEHARTLNLTIELIKDDNPNMLYYPREKLISYNEIFKKFVNFMFTMKEKKLPMCKSILNMLWGCLCEKDKKKYYTYEENNNIIPNDEEIIRIKPCMKNENIDCFITTHRYNPYKTTYARLSPFLLSKGRFMISNLMKPHINNIHYMHTDGFVSDTNLNINGSKMGDLIFEGYWDNVKIVNVGNITGNFNKV